LVSERHLSEYVEVDRERSEEEASIFFFCVS